jgi:predicted porin
MGMAASVGPPPQTNQQAAPELGADSSVCWRVVLHRGDSLYPFVAVFFASTDPIWCNGKSFPQGAGLAGLWIAFLSSTLEIPSMKKTLIALAAVAATGAAFAQSSVTLYGVADISAGKTNVDGDEFRAMANSGLNNGNSRIGFKGIEDLGGGLKAGFNFEQNVSLADGSTGNGTTIATSTDTDTFQRAAWLNLAGSFGEVRLGRSLTTSFYSVADWELTGTANYSAVANQFGFAGAGSRNDAAIMYFSPNFSGFKFGASTVLKGNTGTEAKYDFSLGYGNGPITASFAYNTQKGGKKGMALGGKYNFGAFAVAASYNDVKMEATSAVVAKGFSLGGSANLGPVALTLDVARDTEAKDTDVVLEAKYPLSKRTFAYGVMFRNGKGKTADNVNGYALGLRHNF